jgi:hypothetical protein
VPSQNLTQDPTAGVARVANQSDLVLARKALDGRLDAVQQVRQVLQRQFLIRGGDGRERHRFGRDVELPHQLFPAAGRSDVTTVPGDPLVDDAPGRSEAGPELFQLARIPGRVDRGQQHLAPPLDFADRVA